MATKAQLEAQLAAEKARADAAEAELASAKRPVKELPPGRLFIRRDFRVPLDPEPEFEVLEDGTTVKKKERNPFWGYISIPEGVSGNIRVALWCDRDAERKRISGRLHGEMDLPKD